MFRYLEWIQLNFWQSLTVLFMVRLISSLSNNAAFETITNQVATFASAIVFLSYAISLLRMGDVYHSSDQYPKWEIYLKVFVTVILGCGLMFFSVMSFVGS